MTERWYKEAVIYCVDVETFQDSGSDGYGDFRGLASRLDYLARLGVNCLWLNPIHPTPDRDDGYDVADYYGVDPRIGSLGDFNDFAGQARQRGIRVLLDLVVNHTSDQHPWFQSARSGKDSPYHDWYIWSETEPADRREGVVFPGEQGETWTFDEQAQAWYYHRFYNFQPDLNWNNPQVRKEINKVMAFWLQAGASGFRIDAAPFVLEQGRAGLDGAPSQDMSILDDWRQETQWQKGDSVLLLEANVEPEAVPSYCASRAGGPNDRAQMLFAFTLNPYLWLALARREAEPLAEALRRMPALPAMAQWATFLRNHDELDLSRLTADQRREVFKAFAPKPEMLLYERGIRRRLAGMLGGNLRHMELAYALQFSMPGTPVLRYGEEIGMVEDLRLPARDAIRTPMQWTPEPMAGFTAPDAQGLVRPLVTRGPGSYRKTNVLTEQADPNSLVRWFERLISTLHECPEIGVGDCEFVESTGSLSVLCHRFDAPEGAILMMHNLADTDAVIDVGRVEGMAGTPYEVLADDDYRPPTRRLTDLQLNGWGYRWIRLRRGRGA